MNENHLAFMRKLLASVFLSPPLVALTSGHRRALIVGMDLYQILAQQIEVPTIAGRKKVDGYVLMLAPVRQAATQQEPILSEAQHFRAIAIDTVLRYAEALAGEEAERILGEELAHSTSKMPEGAVVRTNQAMGIKPPDVRSTMIEKPGS